MYVIYLKPKYASSMFFLVPDRVFENPEHAIEEAKESAKNYAHADGFLPADCEWKVVQLSVYSGGIAFFERQK